MRLSRCWVLPPPLDWQANSVTPTWVGQTQPLAEVGFETPSLGVSNQPPLANQRLSLHWFLMSWLLVIEMTLTDVWWRIGQSSAINDLSSISFPCYVEPRPQPTGLQAAPPLPGVWPRVPPVSSTQTPRSQGSYLGGPCSRHPEKAPGPNGKPTEYQGQQTEFIESTSILQRPIGPFWFSSHKVNILCVYKLNIETNWTQKWLKYKKCWAWHASSSSKWL